MTQCVALSRCGNYCAIGYASGRIDVYNMQSGLHRRAFHGHTKAVHALSFDSLSRRLISAGLDGVVILWDLIAHGPSAPFSRDHPSAEERTAARLASVTLDAPVTHLLLHSEADLAAVATDDLIVHVIDIETAKVVRRYPQLEHRVTDMVRDFEF